MRFNLAGLGGFFWTSLAFISCGHELIGLFAGFFVGLFLQLLVWRMTWGNWTPWKD